MFQIDKIMLFDGGFGSELAARGIETNNAMDLNIEMPEVVKEIHKSYKKSDFITTNTFGLNRIKYDGQYDLVDLCNSAIENARLAGKKVMFDIGPTGALLKPLGILSFDDAYEAFAEIVKLTKDKVDGYILETFTDIYELKCAILAVKENCDKPIIASMSYDKRGLTLTGSTPEIVINTLEGLGVDVLGINCGDGLYEIREVVEKYCQNAKLPILVQPNRGIPKYVDGKTIYDLPVEEFVDCISEFVDMGVSLIGGCCGTNPEFIEAISVLKGREIKKCDDIKARTIVNSRNQLIEIDNIVICGERLNPTGKKNLRTAIENEDYDYLIKEAISQAEHGAKVLDLNVGLPKIDEPRIMRNAVEKIQEFCDLPLQIDSSDKDALEAGLRYSYGIPIINSVSAEPESIERVFPLVKKYGANVIVLLLDKNGVPKTSEERFNLAMKMVAEAEKYGIPKNKLIIDCLVLTASAQQDLVKVTLDTLFMVSSLGLKTTLGVSNVSFGLPERSIINKTFLSMACYAGLNMPIINPLNDDLIGAIYASSVLLNYDKNSSEYVERYTKKDTEIESEKKVSNSDITLSDAIIKGFEKEAISLCKEKLKKFKAIDIINNTVIPALSSVGDLFETGKIFLPQLMTSANTAKKAFEIISEQFEKSETVKDTIVMCTVEGDVHDIGKNICKIVLESHGYNVIDLGKDTPIEKVVEAYKKHKPIAIGLSALMTTTVLSMEKTILALREVNCNAKILVGGAVLSKDIAEKIGADYYSKDALELVKIIQNL